MSPADIINDKTNCSIKWYYLTSVSMNLKRLFQKVSDFMARMIFKQRGRKS